MTLRWEVLQNTVEGERNNRRDLKRRLEGEAGNEIQAGKMHLWESNNSELS